jgi:hypothetical protein
MWEAVVIGLLHDAEKWSDFGGFAEWKVVVPSATSSRLSSLDACQTSGFR